MISIDTNTIARKPAHQTRSDSARGNCSKSRPAWCLSIVLSIASEEMAHADWVKQGPSPTLDGQTEGIKGNPVSGAINEIVPDPADANILYVGTVNGGVWKTANAKDASPTWTPLTDTQLPALSIASLASSPVNRNVLFAGTGSTSSNGGEGDPGFGIARSDDGGLTWKVLAADQFKNKRITSIAPSTLGGGTVVLAANFFEKQGVYRSTNNGEQFERISGKEGSGLPDAGVSSLIADPANPQRLYAAIPALVPAITANGSLQPNAEAPGIYRSSDGGITWSRTNTVPVGGAYKSLRILLTLHNTKGNNVLYAAVAVQKNSKGGKVNDVWANVYRSTDQGESWTLLPHTPNVSPGAQASIHGALRADISDPHAVYLSGDVQTDPSNGENIAVNNPNALGCTKWSANIYRYNGKTWESAVCKGANGTSPHADSRNMVFDADGNLLQADDGGIYRLVEPNDRKRRHWVSVLGNLGLAEVISATYDPISSIVFGGTQDNGAAAQIAQNDYSWKMLIEGDGGVVDVDADQNSHPGQSIRYYTYAELKSFTRSTWNAQGRLIKGTEKAIKLRLKGTGKPLTKVDKTVQFYNRYVLNRIDPKRMLIGTTKLYESFNRGDLLNIIYGSNRTKGEYIKALAYGGRSQGADFADVLYAGTSSEADPQPEDDKIEKTSPSSSAMTGIGGDNPADAAPSTIGRILHRVNEGDPITALTAYKGSGVVDLAIDPQDYRHIFVLDDNKRVWASFDEGQKWVELTANLQGLLTGEIRTLAVKGKDDFSQDTVLIAGGGYGVAQLRNPKPEAKGSWAAVDKGLPHALVTDLRYDDANFILVAGTLGRGVWTVSFK